MDAVLPSPWPFGEEGQISGSNREEDKEDCVLQFGGGEDDTYDHLIPLKGC